MHGFTISFPFRKLHGFYEETQQFRVNRPRNGSKKRRETMVKLGIIK